MSLEYQANPYALPSAPQFDTLVEVVAIRARIVPRVAFAYIRSFKRITSTSDPAPIQDIPSNSA